MDDIEELIFLGLRSWPDFT